jgi:hypothetical protein
VDCAGISVGWDLLFKKVRPVSVFGLDIDLFSLVRSHIEGCHSSGRCAFSLALPGGGLMHSPCLWNYPCCFAGCSPPSIVSLSAECSRLTTCVSGNLQSQNLQGVGGLILVRPRHFFSKYCLCCHNLQLALECDRSEQGKKPFFFPFFFFSFFRLQILRVSRIRKGYQSILLATGMKKLKFCRQGF